MMQELTANDLVSLISIFIAVVSLVISIAVFYHSRMLENTRKKEKSIDALSRCHSLLDEVITMHPSMDYPITFVMDDDFVGEINEKAVTLTKLSWSCEVLTKEIQNGAEILKSLVRDPYACDDEYLSNQERKELLDSSIELQNKIWEHLRKLSQ